MNGEMEEFDEKEREKRKQDKIDYRKKQNISNLFLFLGTVFEIIISFVFVLLYFLLSVFITTKLPESAQSIVYNILLIISFIGGIASGFFVYRKLGRLIIDKGNLAPKLRQDILNQFKTLKEFKADQEKKKQQ